MFSHVTSIANHGGNTTGISILAAQLDGKRQELLMELMPNARRMAVIYDAAVQLPAQVQELQSVARVRGVELSIFPTRKPADVVVALDAAKEPMRQPSIFSPAHYSRLPIES